MTQLSSRVGRDPRLGGFHGLNERHIRVVPEELLHFTPEPVPLKNLPSLGIREGPPELGPEVKGRYGINLVTADCIEDASRRAARCKHPADPDVRVQYGSHC
jgi:hypothetical protein